MIVTTLPPAQEPAIRKPVLSLPVWVYDGRKLSWNEDRTAVSFACTDTEYHSDSFACSSTALKALARSPRHLLNARATAAKETPSRRLGTAVHARILEPEMFAQRYVCFPGKRRGSVWRDFKETNKGKEVLTQSEWDLVEKVSERALNEPVISQKDKTFFLRDLVEVGKSEQTIYWLDAETGVTCKARLDLIVGYLTLDVKTTDDARLARFAGQACDLGYDIQAAFYLRARRAMEPNLPCTPFLFVACELLPFGDTLVHQADPEDFVAWGDKEVSKGLKAYAKCVKTGNYTGYAQRGGVLKLPMYKRYPVVEID